MRAPAATIILTLIALVCGLSAAVAQIRIDNFTTPTSLLQGSGGTSASQSRSLLIGGSLASRNLSAFANGSFTMDAQVTNGLWFSDGGGTAGFGTAAAEYIGFSINLNTNVFFQLNFNRVFGTPALTFIMRSSGTFDSLIDSIVLNPTTNGYSTFFDVRTNATYNTNFLVGVNDITVLLDMTNQSDFAEISLIQFSPVPEPATWAMLAAAGGLLALVARRRREFP
jgi:hypothetical protein